MSLSEALKAIVSRAPQKPYEKGKGIPWDDPVISERILNVHLSQDNDLGSRRFHRIDAQVEWMKAHVLQDGPQKVLDLASGPGFYLDRLAELGHHGKGIDLSPASINYAKKNSKYKNFSHEQGDLLSTPFGDDYDLVMMLYGQFNVFSKAEAMSILERAQNALKPGGTLLLEVQSYESLDEVSFTHWEAEKSGLFTDKPHLLLHEIKWHEESECCLERWFILDAESGETQYFSQTSQAYSEDDLFEMLEETGFTDIDTAVPEAEEEDLFFLIAKKPE